MGLVPSCFYQHHPTRFFQKVHQNIFELTSETCKTSLSESKKPNQLRFLVGCNLILISQPIFFARKSPNDTLDFWGKLHDQILFGGCWMRHSSIGAPSVREGCSFKETFEGTLLGGGRDSNPIQNMQKTIL